MESVALTRVRKTDGLGRVGSVDSGWWSEEGDSGSSSDILSVVDLEAGLGGSLSLSALSLAPAPRPALPLAHSIKDGIRRFTSGGRKQTYHVRTHHILSLAFHRGRKYEPVSLVISTHRGWFSYPVALLTTILPGVAMTDESSSLINRTLPKELILRIFSYLDIVCLCRCAGVCGLWNRLALDGSNWQDVDFFQFQKDIRTPVVESLARRCGGFLKRLSLFACENVQDRALRTFAEKCGGIEELNLRKCKRLTDATCEALGGHCKRIRHLNLDSCAAVTEAGLRQLSLGCPNLRHLDISWCQSILDPGLEAIATGCPGLQALHAKGCLGLTDAGISAVARGCGDLRILNLHSCPALTDDAVVAVGAGCSLLEFLSISMCPRMTDLALVALSKGCPFLRDLEVTDAGVSALAKQCHDLERMDLEDCSLLSDVSLGQLGTGCPRLVSLSLSHCELVTDEGIRQLSLGLLHQDRLRVLELDNCPLITDASLEHLREVRTLHNVDLYDCQAITRPGIRRFKQYLPDVTVHAYFAPVTPPANQPQRRSGFCRCCNIL